MSLDWFDISLTEAIGIILTTLGLYVGMMIIVRINGLRSFAKLSSHDFAVTVAIGSILAAICIQKEPALLHGLLAIATFLFLQALYSYWRLSHPHIHLDNEPLLIMENGKILEDNLKKSKMTKEDLMSKLREANVLQFSEVRAAVFEPSGDISILHGKKEVDKELLENVRRSY